MNFLMAFVVMLFFGCGEKTIEDTKVVQKTNTFDSPVSAQDWAVVSGVSNPDSFNLIVTYQEKYGSERTVFCKALFSNTKTKQFKLVSPESSSILEMDNIVSIKYYQREIK